MQSGSALICNEQDCKQAKQRGHSRSVPVFISTQTFRKNKGLITQDVISFPSNSNFKQGESFMLRDAYPFLLALLLFAVVASLVGYNFSAGFYYLAVLFVLLAGFVAFFFRNPERAVSPDSSLVLSPADGHVSLVKPIDTQNPAAGNVVSIFLSVFDVHVNRTPIAGRITEVTYRKGKFLNALNHRASSENEQNMITVQNERLTVTFTQIAGVIARRIVFWKKIGDTLEPGERVGLIRFGSRTDLFLPPQVEIMVKKGDRVLGGQTIIGKIRA